MQALGMKTALAGRVVATKQATRSAARSSVVVRAERPLWAPGVAPPEYLDGTLAGDRGFDPLGLCAEAKMRTWYQQAELQNGRWAMLGVAGILGQEILNPNQFWYTAGMPENVPDLYYGPNGVNLGGLLAWEFLLFHYVEVRRWQDIRNHHSVDEDPIFKGNKVPNEEMGYPGGIFDPLGFSKGDFKQMKEKEIKNARLAMVAFVGFVIQAQATGKGPLANIADHVSNPFAQNITKNIGNCMIPESVDIQGLTLPLFCLWPGSH
ncbi:hypothetical protein N2152v2_008504 [Parachlorella kessleri]